jgi:hypothetical protein
LASESSNINLLVPDELAHHRCSGATTPKLDRADIRLVIARSRSEFHTWLIFLVVGNARCVVTSLGRYCHQIAARGTDGNKILATMRASPREASPTCRSLAGIHRDNSPRDFRTTCRCWLCRCRPPHGSEFMRRAQRRAGPCKPKNLSANRGRTN